MSHRIVAIGEVLWDLLPSGRVLGGAPANFAVHARALGDEVQLISRVGDDRLGWEALQRLEALGVGTDLVSLDPILPTGTVSVQLEAGQPHYVIHENVAWDSLMMSEATVAAVATAEAICFGTLAQRTSQGEETVQALVAASRADALRVFDINLRQAFYSREIIEASLELANVLKLNDTELPVLAEIFGSSGDLRDQLTALADRFSLTALAYTRGEHGSLLWRDGQWSEHAGRPTQVRDTVGAGDAFTAVLVNGLLGGEQLDVLHHRAAEVAAYVCTQDGPTPSLPPALRA